MTKFTEIVEKILDKNSKKIAGLSAIELREYFFENIPFSVYSTKYGELIKELKNHINWYKLEERYK